MKNFLFLGNQNLYDEIKAEKIKQMTLDLTSFSRSPLLLKLKDESK